MRSLKPMALIFTLILTLGLAGCGSSSKKNNSGAPDTSNTTTQDQDMGSDGMSLQINGDSDAGKAGPLQTINFPFNSSNLTSEARQTLQDNAEFLKQNPEVEIQVEGHCDERGGVQYNLALGERRAEATKQYLVSLGVNSSRISTISFGKERPIAFGHNPTAWSKNRRANFVVTAK